MPVYVRSALALDWSLKFWGKVGIGDKIWAWGQGCFKSCKELCLLRRRLGKKQFELTCSPVVHQIGKVNSGWEVIFFQYCKEYDLSAVKSLWKILFESEIYAFRMLLPLKLFFEQLLAEFGELKTVERMKKSSRFSPKTVFLCFLERTNPDLGKWTAVQ